MSSNINTYSFLVDKLEQESKYKNHGRKSKNKSLFPLSKTSANCD